MKALYQDYFQKWPHPVVSVPNVCKAMLWQQWNSSVALMLRFQTWNVLDRKHDTDQAFFWVHNSLGAVL